MYQWGKPKYNGANPRGGWQVPSRASLLRQFLKCLLTLSLTEQPLLPVPDVFVAGWVENILYKARQHYCAEDDQWPRILKLNTKGPIASKISIIEQLAYKNKHGSSSFRKTHCTTASLLVVPNFSLAGSVPSKKRNLATCVHEHLELRGVVTIYRCRQPQPAAPHRQRLSAFRLYL